MTYSIGWITCKDLSRYFPSAKNPLLTHDDQWMVDNLEARGHRVYAVPWGMPVRELTDMDVLVVRSPWDYMDSRSTTDSFFQWLQDVDQAGILLTNPLPVLKWNLNKHYLKALGAVGVPVLPCTYGLGWGRTCEKELLEGLRAWTEVVVKPVISAAAKDTFRFHASLDVASFQPLFQQISQGREFMMQPFVEAIRKEGEWSCVFLDNRFIHAVRKQPAPGHWLVQDELGGSVHWDTPSKEVIQCAEAGWHGAKTVLAQVLGYAPLMLYGRVDVLPGMYIGELELVEPELFFLDRRTNKPSQLALDAFVHGLQSLFRRGV